MNKKPKSAKKRKEKKIEVFKSKYNIDILSKLNLKYIPLLIKMYGFKTEYSNFETSVPIEYTFSKVADIINAKNNYSCRNIELFIEDEHKSLKNAMHKNFLELGIKPEPTVILYKFDPVIDPLLLARFS